MASNSITTPTLGGTAAPSTKPAALGRQPAVGDLVLVKVDESIRRPMLITACGSVLVFDRPSDASGRQEFRVSGTIFCEPDDHARPAFRGALDRQGDPAAISGRPDRMLPLGYGQSLAYGTGLGQWIPKPSQLPAGEGR